jgi:AraC-like DNA-binding protein
MNVLRISTAAWEPKQRIEMFREIFGRKILKIDVEPDPGEFFEADMILQSLPGLGVGGGSISKTRNTLTPELIDNDDLVFVMLQSGGATARQYGREGTIGGGQALVTANDAPAIFMAHSPARVLNLRFERKKLAPSLADSNSIVVRPMSRSNPALGLLASYMSIVRTEAQFWSLDLQIAAAEHIHDLAALALGATREAAEIAKGRGVRFARLHAIKADIIANTASNWISADSLATRHGVSARYIRSLFHGEGTTLTNFVLEQRLARAHALLVAPSSGGRSIHSVALDAGFDDLSYFNRCFRRRYAATPSDIRAAGRRESGR